MAVGDQLFKTLGPFILTPSSGKMSITQGEAEIFAYRDLSRFKFGPAQKPDTVWWSSIFGRNRSLGCCFFGATSGWSICI